MKRKPIPILLCLYLFHIISNYVWLKVDTAYQLFDPAVYHLSSLGLYEALKNFPSALFSKDLFTSFGRRSGLFVGFITAPFYFIFGTSQDAAAMVSGSLFLAILLFSVYGIGRKLQDERTGLLGAFITSMYPIVFNQLRVYMFDLPLCAFVSLNIYLLICSDGFRNKFFTVLYALSVALGALIKFNFLAFTIGPMLLVLCKGSERVTRKHLAVSLVITAAIILIFGAHSLKLMLFYSFDVSRLKNIIYSLEGAYSDRIISVIILWFYSFLIFLATLVNDSLTFFFSLIFIIGLLIVLKLKFKYTTFLLLPVLIPLFFLIFIFITVESIARYMLPGYVFIALISSIGVMNIRFAYLRRIIVILILLVGLIQYFAVSYGCSFLPREIKINLPNFLMQPPFFSKIVATQKQAPSYIPGSSYLKSVAFFQQEIPIFPHKGSSHPEMDYKNRQIVNSIMKNCPFKEGDSFVFLDYHNDIAEILYPLKFEAFRKTKAIETVTTPFYIDYNLPPNKYTPVWQYLLTTDYIATMEGMLKRADLMYHPALKEEIRKTKEYFYNHLYAFKVVYKVELPDGRVLSVYKNILNDIIEGPLEIKIGNKEVKLFYQGKKITEGRGLDAYFKYNQKYYSSNDAIWEIQKPDSNCILARLSWPGLDLAQVWELRLQDGRINWQVYLDNPKKLLLPEVGMQFHLTSSYQKWQDCFTAGRFPEILPGMKNSREIRRDAFPCNAFIIEPDNLTQAKLPGFLLQNMQENYFRDISLRTGYFNQTQKASILQINLLTPQPDLAGAKSLLFSGRLSLFTNPADVQGVLKPKPILKQGPLELFFNPAGGIFKLFYNGKEITERSGLNMCYGFEGKYYGSDQLVWQIDKATQDKIIARGSYPDLPFTQFWHLGIPEDNVINWQIDIEAEKEIKIEAGPYINLILPYDYQRWVTLNKRGAFPSILPWHKKWVWLGVPSPYLYIGVEEKKRSRGAALPALLLKVKDGLALGLTVPQNTDYLMMARALDIQRSKDTKEPLVLDTGRHEIFSGQIIIFEKNEDMNLFLKKISHEGRIPKNR